MEWQGWFSLALTAGVLLLLTGSQLRPHIVMMGALTLLSVSGVLTPAEALSGFSNSGLVTVGAMFVVAAGIYSSGGIDILVNSVLGKPRTLRAALARIFFPVSLLSGFVNNTPVVASLIPAVHAWARSIGISPSKLLIPLSYSAILGGTLTMIGTSTNLIINGQYQQITGQDGFSLFSITAIGLPVALFGIAYMLLVFPRMLPDYKSDEAFSNLKEFTLEVAVTSNGPLVGKSIQRAGLRELRRIYLVEIVRGDTVLAAISPEELLQGGDRLVFAGDTEAIADLLRIKGIEPSPDIASDSPLMINRPERCLVEAVVSPHCAAIGEALRDFRFRDHYGAVVLAVARHGERVLGNLGSIHLAPGDTLLLEARPEFVSRQRLNRDFLLVNALDKETPRHSRAPVSWMILVAMIVAVTLDYISMLNASLLGAGLMVMCGCCTASQAERSVDLTVLITIGASLALGEALLKTGVATYLADFIISFSGNNPWLLLILVYIAVSALTEVITNNSAAVIMLPLVLEMTERTQLSHEPFVMVIMMAASASFATPLGYQTNLMVYGPGGYRFSDFIKIGLPMNVVIGIATLCTLRIAYGATL